MSKHRFLTIVLISIFISLSRSSQVPSSSPRRGLGFGSSKSDSIHDSLQDETDLANDFFKQNEDWWKDPFAMFDDDDNEVVKEEPKHAKEKTRNIPQSLIPTRTKKFEEDLRESTMLFSEPEILDVTESSYDSHRAFNEYDVQSTQHIPVPTFVPQAPPMVQQERELPPPPSPPQTLPPQEETTTITKVNLTPPVRRVPWTTHVPPSSEPPLVLQPQQHSVNPLIEQATSAPVGYSQIPSETRAGTMARIGTFLKAIPFVQVLFSIAFVKVAQPLLERLGDDHEYSQHRMAPNDQQQQKRSSERYDDDSRSHRQQQYHNQEYSDEKSGWGLERRYSRYGNHETSTRGGGGGSGSWFQRVFGEPKEILEKLPPAKDLIEQVEYLQLELATIKSEKEVMEKEYEKASWQVCLDVSLIS
jgi:hypothetical protein